MPDRFLHLDPLSRAAIAVIAVVAGFTALKLAEDVLAPLTLALVAGIILAPLADILERGLPRSLVAALLPALGLVGLFALAFLLEPVIARLVEAWPQIKWELRGILIDFRAQVQRIAEVNEEVTSALGGGGAPDSGDGDGEGASRAVPALTDALFLAPRLAAQLLIFVAALFFFLLSRKEIYGWLADRIGRRVGSEAVLARIRTAEWLVSRYFLAITLVNATLGTAVAAGLTLIGMPGALVWGACAALLNYILYLGPAVMVGALLMGGLIAFDGLATLLPVAVFVSLNMVEAQFVTPTFVSRHLAVNPLLIFVSLVFWLWLWGPLGGVIAIPVLVTVLAMFDAFDRPMPVPQAAEP